MYMYMFSQIAPFETFLFFFPRVLIGRTHVHTVAEARKAEVEKFLKQIVNLANEVSEVRQFFFSGEEGGNFIN